MMGEVGSVESAWKFKHINLKKKKKKSWQQKPSLFLQYDDILLGNSACEPNQHSF